MNKAFNIWIFGDAHVGTDLKQGRASLKDALVQTKSTSLDPAFNWDLAINVGDLSGEQGLPTDREGEELVRQFSVLDSEERHLVYSVCGNHDRSGLAEKPAHWFRKWIDPLGENSKYSGVDLARYKYPVQGNWERYSFEFGNILFLMMSDINEPTQRLGRGDLGGNPGGVVSQETFAWWQNMVQNNQDKIIISVHHYMLKDTTVATGAWEGMQKDSQGDWQTLYHGYKEKGTPAGASYLYWVGSQPDAHAFEDYLQAHPGSIDIWLGGHTHTYPDDRVGGKTHIEKRWGVNFINAAGLTRYHVSYPRFGIPMSRLLQLKEGSDVAELLCFLHTSDYKSPGWYEPAKRTIQLSKPFVLG